MSATPLGMVWTSKNVFDSDESFELFEDLGSEVSSLISNNEFWDSYVRDEVDETLSGFFRGARKHRIG